MDKNVEISIDEKAFNDMPKDKSKLFIVSWIERPGVSVFMCDLEYNHFPPGTPVNDAYQFYMKKWEGMLWSIVQVPIIYKDLVWKVAEQNGMRVADGIPQMLGGPDGHISFPLQGDNVFTLEIERGSQVYDGESSRQELLVKEKTATDKIIADHMASLGEMCTNCGCFHDETYEKKHPEHVVAIRAMCTKFDPKALCRLCKNPIGHLSMGGPEICSWCDSGHPPETPLEGRHEYWKHNIDQEANPA